MPLGTLVEFCRALRSLTICAPIRMGDIVMLVISAQHTPGTYSSVTKESLVVVKPLVDAKRAAVKPKSMVETNGRALTVCQIWHTSPRRIRANQCLTRHNGADKLEDYGCPDDNRQQPLTCGRKLFGCNQCHP